MLIDEKNYTVVGINGYRVGSLTREQAFKLAGRLREQMKQAGWAGKVRVYYRDGSVAQCGGKLSNGPEKSYVRCEKCHAIDYERNEGDSCLEVL